MEYVLPKKYFSVQATYGISTYLIWDVYLFQLSYQFHHNYLSCTITTKGLQAVGSWVFPVWLIQLVAIHPSGTIDK
uniref:Uncharacterized protein n=1 Tax=Lepeophtheirus salmonis TaxID=72036 RepID=A0A0K2TQX5_LEPSM